MQDYTNFNAQATIAAVAAARRAELQAAASLMALAAHFADLHSCVDEPQNGRVLPGVERLISMGSDGTPEVAEFATLELAAALNIGA